MTASSTSRLFLALLRGINVGGKNTITKDELRATFESSPLYFTHVKTYIQSGNIIFRTTATRATMDGNDHQNRKRKRPQDKYDDSSDDDNNNGTDDDVNELTTRIEQALSNRFNYDAKAVVFSHEQYKSMIQSAPTNWGQRDGNNKYRHDAVFIMNKMITAKDILTALPTPPNDAIERVTVGGDGSGENFCDNYDINTILFCSTLTSEKDNNKTTFINQLPKQKSIYQQVTMRNSNTCYKLLRLLEDDEKQWPRLKAEVKRKSEMKRVNHNH